MTETDRLHFPFRESGQAENRLSEWPVIHSIQPCNGKFLSMLRRVSRVKRVDEEASHSGALKLGGTVTIKSPYAFQTHRAFFYQEKHSNSAADCRIIQEETVKWKKS